MNQFKNSNDMKRTYIKPQTVATVLENECAIMAGSQFSVGIDTSKSLESDDAVGAKGHTGMDFWADDEE